MVEDLPDLVRPTFAFDEEFRQPSGPAEESPVAGQERPAVLPRHRQEVVVLSPGKIKDVEAEDLQPFRQFPQHAVDDKIHR